MPRSSGGSPPSLHPYYRLHPLVHRAVFSPPPPQHLVRHTARFTLGPSGPDLDEHLCRLDSLPSPTEPQLCQELETEPEVTPNSELDDGGVGTGRHQMVMRPEIGSG